MAHVNKEHADAVKALCDAPQNDRVGILSFFHPKKGKNVFGWMEIIHLRRRPFSTLEDNYIVKHLNLESICVNTFKSYTDKLVKRVEEKISKTLPNRFCLVFDGWSSGSTHYLAIFATFPSDNKLGFDRVLLTFSPMGDKRSLDAEQHVEFMKITLKLYRKSLANVVAFVADNCAINKRAARLANVPLVGCASHHFNLAVMDIVNGYSPEVDKVRALMVLLRNLIPAAALREHTSLAARIACPTRWGSYYKMLKRYLDIKEIFYELDITSVEEALLTARDNRKIEKCEDLQGISLSMQKEDTSISAARVNMDTVIDAFPELASRLGVNADIVEWKEFESALVLIQDGKLSELSAAQRSAVATLKEGSTYDAVAVDDGSPRKLSLVQIAKKKRKQKVSGGNRIYMDTRFIVHTSNMVESFFPRAGYALNDRRRDLLPVNLESQMFLFANADHWNVNDVSRIV